MTRRRTVMRLANRAAQRTKGRGRGSRPIAKSATVGWSVMGHVAATPLSSTCRRWTRAERRRRGESVLIFIIPQHARLPRGAPGVSFVAAALFDVVVQQRQLLQQHLQWQQQLQQHLQRQQLLQQHLQRQQLLQRQQQLQQHLQRQQLLQQHLQRQQLLQQDTQREQLSVQW
eukprot:gene12061-biopygen5360